MAKRTTQKQQVIDIMRENGGYATLQHINHMFDFSASTAKEPQANIRGLVQRNDEFFKIKPGLWALTECKDIVLETFKLKENDKKSEEEFTHSYIQGMIVEIGNIKHYKTYIPNQDKNRLFLKKHLSEIATEAELPAFTYKELTKRAKTVDVIWFNKRNMPCRFYEVEHSTNITNSLDKFYELQDFRADFYIIADESRHNQFNSLISRSIYNPIKDYVKFFNYEKLATQYEKETSLMNMDIL